MKIYRSRIGWEIWGPAALLFGFCVYKTNAFLPAILFLLLIALFLVTMVLKTRYIISGDKLFVKCWPVIDLGIDIKSIHRIRKTWSPLSSPAASYFGRIEVFYDMGKSTIISPKDKKAFIADLVSRNKSILTFEVK